MATEYDYLRDWYRQRKVTAGFHLEMARAFQSVGKMDDARSAAIAWFRATADDETPDETTARRMATIILGDEPTAEDWDRLPEIVG